MNGCCCVPEVKAGGDEALGNFQPLCGCRSTVEGARSEILGIQTQSAAFSLALKVHFLPALHVEIPVTITGAFGCDLSGPCCLGSVSWRDRQERASGETVVWQNFGVCWEKQLQGGREGECMGGIWREKTCLSWPGSPSTNA